MGAQPRTASRIPVRPSPPRKELNRTMNLKNAACLSPLTTAALLSALAASAPARPLPSDPRILTGTTANGVTWIYRKHDNPPGKMALMMHVRTGSLNETDAQRGLAHFMEHMMFNGTENFPPGKLIPYFEGIGMKFGADVNANTSFDRTIYMLFLPDAQGESIDKALTVLSDYAFRATLNEAEIDKERGVILEEARGRKSAEQRIRDRLWPQLYAGSRFAARLPIGDPEVVAKAPRSEFVDYYRTWYRPENVTVVLVGDADPKPIVPLIEKSFGTYKAEVPARKPLRAEFKPFTEERAFVMTDPEVTTGRVQMLSVRPGRPPTVTVEQLRTELVEAIANRILARRFDERVKRGLAGYRSASTGVDAFFHEALAVSGTATGEPADWAKMLEELIVEVSRAREYGFTEGEMKLIRREVIATRERAVRTESTQNARTIIEGIINAVNEGTPVLSAQQELDLMRELLPTVSASEVSETFRRHFTPGTFAYVVTLPEKEGMAVPGRDDVLAAARAAWARRVEPPTGDEGADELLAKPLVPGRMVETTRDDDLGITSGWLENGIRVHHRFMDYKKDTVFVSLTLAGGGIEETAENVGVSLVAGLAISTPATSRLDSIRIRDLMVGKNVKVGGGPVADDAFVIRIGGSPKDLETGLQLAHALITDGRIEETAFKNWRLATLRDIERNQTSVTFKAGEALADLLSGGDPRRLPLSKARVEALSVAQGQAWLDRLCRSAPIEAAVVGDMPWDEVRPLIERYVGSLPKRARSAEHLIPLRKLARGTGPLVRSLRVETVTPTAIAYAGFVGCEGRNADDRRALQVAASILSSRLIKQVREELSLVYSIGAESSPSWIYRDAGRFQSGSKCKPGNTETVAEEVRKAFDAFAASGPTTEELEAARKQILNHLDTNMKEPMYWIGLLEHLDLRGRSLDEPRADKAKYATITAGEVQAAFRKYWTPARSFTVTAEPVTPRGDSQKEPDATKAEPAAAASP